MVRVIFYSIVFCFLFVATGKFDLSTDTTDTQRAAALYVTRRQWLNSSLFSRLSNVFYDRLPSSFMGDVEEGFTSHDFNLGENIVEGDTRSGLDEAGKREVKNIMKKNNLGFDEARKLYIERRFAKHNIDPEVTYRSR